MLVGLLQEFFTFFIYRHECFSNVREMSLFSLCPYAQGIVHYLFQLSPFLLHLYLYDYEHNPPFTLFVVHPEITVMVDWA